MPENMRAFWRFLMIKDLPADSLAATATAVFGLGDSSYQLYNIASKKLYRRLEQLGSVSLCPRGEGDDQHRLGPDGGLDPWLADSFWPAVLDRYPLPDGFAMGDAGALPAPPVTVTFREASHDGAEATPAADPAQAEADAIADDVHSPPPDLEPAARFDAYGPDNPFPARLVSNDRITAPGCDQDVRHIVLDLWSAAAGERSTLPPPRYGPGDVVCIRPRNLTWLVDAFLERLSLDGSALVDLSVRPGREDLTLPDAFVAAGPGGGVTIRELCTGYFDLTAPPRRYFFELGQHFTESEMEREQLAYFGSTDGQEDLHRYNQRESRTVVEVLEDFPGLAPPLAYLFDMLQPIQARAFSIASAAALEPGQIHVALAVVAYKTVIRRPRWGLCSAWLAGLDAGAVLPIWTRRGTMRLPPDPTTPIIMVGPGTGVAPFRNFVRTRITEAGGTADGGANVLFFGCRREAEDYIFRDEWETLAGAGLVEVFTAFSRDQADKVYVQHRLAEQGARVWDLLSAAGAHFYVCGNAQRMPLDVREAVVTIAMDEGGLSEEEAADFVRSLEKGGRYEYDTWY